MGGSKHYNSSGGFSEYKYTTVKVIGDIHVLTRKEGESSGLPKFSGTKNRIYGSYRPDGKAKQIQFYNNERKQYKRLDLDHDHGEQKGWHVQEYRDGREVTRYKLSKKEKRLAYMLITGKGG